MNPGPVAQATQDTQTNCIFCKIVKGEIPARKVFEDDKVLVVLDVYPATPGHLIIIPKQHYMILPQLPPDLAKHISVVSKRMSALTLQSLEAQGVNVFAANGAVAGQKAPHFLVHVIPRYENDGINFTLPEIQANDTDLEQLYEQIMPVVSGLGLGGTAAGTIQAAPTQQPAQQGAQPMPAPAQAQGGADLDKISQMMDGSPQPTAQPAPAHPAAAPVQQSAPQQPATPQHAHPTAQSITQGTAIDREATIMELVEHNPQLKQMILSQPDKLAQVIPQDPQLAQLFAGIDIHQLAQKISGGQQAPAAHAQPVPSAPAQPTAPQPSPAAPPHAPPQPGQQTFTEDQLIQILNQNPQVKQLVIEQPNAVIQAIPSNPQLQQLFAGVDIHALSAKLRGTAAPQPAPAHPAPAQPAQQQPAPGQSNLDAVSAAMGAPTPKKEEKKGADLDKISQLFGG